MLTTVLPASFTFKLTEKCNSTHLMEYKFYAKRRSLSDLYDVTNDTTEESFIYTAASVGLYIRDDLWEIVEDGEVPEGVTFTHNELVVIKDNILHTQMKGHTLTAEEKAILSKIAEVIQ